MKLPDKVVKGRVAVDMGRRRHRLIPQAILLGLLTGAISVGFHLCVDIGEAFRDRFIAMAHRQDTGPWMIMGFVFVTVVVSAGLVRFFAPEAAGSGIPHLKALLMEERKPFRWLRVLIVKFISMMIGSTGGLVLGREGPSVHMGGAIGQGLARFWPGKSGLDQSIMLAAGGGAGLAAAFNAPLSGLTFVLEELERRCGSFEFFVAAIACLMADMLCRAVLGQHPSFHFAIHGAPPLNLLLAFVPLGILSAFFGMLFTRILLWGQKFVTMGFRATLIWWGMLTVAVTLAAWYTPMLLGGGQGFINEMLTGREMTLESVALFFAIRFLLTMASASSGAAGGIFMPILALGALLGWSMGVGIHLLFPEIEVNNSLFAVVGMAAYFSAVVQAPLTGIVLIIEMTENYALVLPLFITCFSALLIADWLGTPPVYEALLENDLRKE
ncbi:MAG: H(+)/Cl(-) exchange transporter ClcA [Methylococcales bacterium]|nr:H(+)/Cl(-) exchange transporter ClcA [Methylococcales bacterium]